MISETQKAIEQKDKTVRRMNDQMMVVFKAKQESMLFVMKEKRKISEQ